MPSERFAKSDEPAKDRSKDPQSMNSDLVEAVSEDDLSFWPDPDRVEALAMRS